jgi:predicted ATPase
MARLKKPKVTKKVRPENLPHEPSLTAITLRGFKSFRDETRIEIRPLTLLAGANSSGKSSAIQPLLLLKQTLEAGYDPGPLLLDGPNIKFTAMEQTLWRDPRHKNGGAAFSLGLARLEESTHFRFAEAKDGSVDLREVAYQAGGDSFTLRPSMTDAELRSQDVFPLLTPQELKSKSYSFHVERDRCSLFAIAEDSSGFALARPTKTSPDPFGPLKPVVRALIHLPGLRGNPERSYVTSAVGRYFPGLFQTYTASIISHWNDTGDARLASLGDALAKLGLAFHVEPRRLDATRIELRVTRFASPEQGHIDDTVNIADVGFGVSQTLPVVVALLAARPGQTVYLEQPEIHLHPRAQVALAVPLIDAAKRGVVVIAETHSDLLIRSIQRAVAAGEVDPALVALHWFERDKKTGATAVSSAELDAAGTYGDWPIDFADVELKLESDFLDASLRHPA